MPKAKEINADSNNTSMDTISHASQIGSDIIFDSIIFTTNKNGIPNKKDKPTAVDVFLPIHLKTANINHKNTIDIADITAPIENTSLVLSRQLNRYKYGITKILNDIKLAAILFFRNLIHGKDTTHANAIELPEISDHVKPPDIAISHMQHIIIPARSVIEKISVIISVFKAMHRRRNASAAVDELRRGFFFDRHNGSASEILRQKRR